MEFLFYLLLFGLVAHLYSRSRDLERRLRALDSAVDGLHYRVANAAAPKAEQAVGEVAEGAALPAQQPAKPTAADIPAKAAASPWAVPASRGKADPEPVARQEEVADQPAEPPFAAIKRGLIPSFDFEDIFGRLLPIWAGGITLAVAGFFLVQYSIENGLLGPQVRVALGFLFGTALLGAAELAYRGEARISDPRVRQALAGAGLATLYASFYLAGTGYGLVGSGIAFLGLAGVTGAAILLSFRFGLPSAVLGLVGGFAAPLMVDSDNPNVALLALYLALVTGGLTHAGNRQGRSWLALAALAGGLGWGALMLFSGVTGTTDVLALGGYLVVLGAIIPAVTDGRDAAPWIRMGAACLAALQLAVMVHQAGYSLLVWGLYGLLAAAMAFFAWRDARLRLATGFAALLAVLMLAMWQDPAAGSFALVGGGMLAIFCGVPLAQIYRGMQAEPDSWQLRGFALAMVALLYGHFEGAGNANVLALACLAIALLPALAGYLLCPKPETRLDRAGTVTVSAAAIGVACAGLIAAPLWAAPLVLALVALGLIAMCWQRQDDPAMLAMLWSAAAAALTALLGTPTGEEEFQRLGGLASESDLVQAVLRWVSVMAVFTALAIRRHALVWTRIAEAGAVLLAYGMFAQFLPADALAPLAAGGAIVLALWQQPRFAARLAAMGIALLWAIGPVGIWLVDAIGSLRGQVMMIAGDLGWRDIALYLVPALVAVTMLIWRPANDDVAQRLASAITAGILALVAVHIGFKQIFAVMTPDRFVALGMAERTVWQALLLAAAMGLGYRFAGERRIVQAATALALAGLAHFAIYSLAWHNPLWTSQLVGTVPVLNLLTLSYGIALVGLWWVSRHGSFAGRVPHWVADSAMMVLISLLALSSLRHLFAGADLTATTMSQTEDLLRSLLGIVVALAFLAWGARTQSRSWRIGSLILMLGAVCKVFLLDASGLEGLLRVASFVALGFSLIGLGWFYARQLGGGGSKEK